MAKLNRIEIKFWDDKSDELIFHFIGNVVDLHRYFSTHYIPDLITKIQYDFDQFQEVRRVDATGD